MSLVGGQQYTATDHRLSRCFWRSRTYKGSLIFISSRMHTKSALSKVYTNVPFQMKFKGVIIPMQVIS